MKKYRARIVVTEDGVMEDATIGVSDGIICSIGQENHTHDLGDVVVVPGLVNGHSHAFQRLIRGRTEYRDCHRADDDFWSWRARMYDSALSLEPADMLAVARMAFYEMALSGITAVGEFHYIHHQPNGDAYDDPNELAHQVIRGAREVGLRINLLRVGYQRAGHGRRFLPSQRRFVEPDVDTYLNRVEDLATRWAHDPLVSVGMAPHSIRAVPQGWLRAIAKHQEASGRVVHIHACEQRRELEECQDEYGRGPLSVLADSELLSSQTTIIHGTHLDDDALNILGRLNPTVCACPTTERNLGDGFLPTKALLSQGVSISLGSDGQSQIDLWADARLLEYHERLRDERRNVLASFAPNIKDRQSSALPLWPMLHENGARSLGMTTGGLSVGRPADFVTLDLNDTSLCGTTASQVIDDLIFSVNLRAVKDVYVNGCAIVSVGQHAMADRIRRDYLALVKRLD